MATFLKLPSSLQTDVLLASVMMLVPATVLNVYSRNRESEPPRLASFNYHALGAVQKWFGVIIHDWADFNYPWALSGSFS